MSELDRISQAFINVARLLRGERPIYYEQSFQKIRNWRFTAQYNLKRGIR